MLSESKKISNTDIKKFFSFIRDITTNKEEPVEKIYRLYYDASGNVISYSIEEIKGLAWIQISKEEYAEARQDVRVKNGKIIFVHKNKQVFKYEKKIDGDISTSKYDINILVDEDVEHDNWEYVVYEL